MQFLVLAHDGTDADAPARRQRMRAEHLAAAGRLRAHGNFIMGVAILDPQGQMIGSAVVLEFPDRAQLDAYLARDPYVTGNVWQRIEVQPFRVADVHPVP